MINEIGTHSGSDRPAGLRLSRLRDPGQVAFHAPGGLTVTIYQDIAGILGASVALSLFFDRDWRWWSIAAAGVTLLIVWWLRPLPDYYTETHEQHAKRIRRNQSNVAMGQVCLARWLLVQKLRPYPLPDDQLLVALKQQSDRHTRRVYGKLKILKRPVVGVKVTSLRPSAALFEFG